MSWSARSALAFVNGTSASLAVAALNQLEIAAQARACAALTGRAVAMLGCNPEAYSEQVQQVRGHAGQRQAAQWIRAELGQSFVRQDNRPLQKPLLYRSW